VKSGPVDYLYRPLLERSLVNYQVQHLGRTYDFGKQSRVAALVVEEVNRQIEKAEDQLGIRRLRPFHLYLKRAGQDLSFPLFAPEYLEPILRQQGGFRVSRQLMIRACEQAARTARMSREELLAVVDPDAFARQAPRRRKTGIALDGQSEEPPWNERIRRLIDSVRPLSAAERVDALDTTAPASVVGQLGEFVQQETGRGPTVSHHLVQELISLRNVCCPRVGQVKSGQMPFLATSVNAHLSEEVATRYRRLSPVILTLWTPEELKRSIGAQDPPSDEQWAERIVRVCFEAYRQGGLLSLMDLQWIFHISARRISELIRWVQRECSIIVPTPGTILDSGRSMTHKDIVVELHLAGYTVREIARRTYHSPRAVDNYIGTFESVLILDLYHFPRALTARILKKGISLIDEHLDLVRKHFRDEEDRKRLLAWKEVKF
jgi:hypothetical protein